MGGGAPLPGGKAKKGAAGRQEFREGAMPLPGPQSPQQRGSGLGVARVRDGILGHHTQRPEIAGQETQ